MTKVRQIVRYCDQNLPCTGIEKGDDFTTIIQKLDDALCKGSGKTYTFEDNIEECENGGFNVYENDELVYTWCQECCGGVQERILETITWEQGDSCPFSSNKWEIPIVDCTSSNYSAYTVIRDGKYKIIYEQSFTGDIGSESNLLTGISVNGQSPLFSPKIEENSNVTKFYTIPENEKVDSVSVFTLNLSEGDIVNPVIKFVIGGGIIRHMYGRVTIEEI